MQRVTRSTAVAVLPAPPAGAGSPGYFTGGNPGTGTPATVPGFEWFNGVQEELMHVIETAGLSGSSTDHTKLFQAIQLLVAAGTVPTGAMLPFPGTVAPAGWAKINGIVVPRSGGWAGVWAYAQSSGNLVTEAEWLAGRPGSFSTGDGSTTMRIPDKRGLFDRGFHDGSSAYESNIALLLGAYRDSENKAHAHTFTRHNGNGNTSGTGYHHGNSEYSAPAITTVSTEGNVEGFPRHSTSLWCIKL